MKEPLLNIRLKNNRFSCDCKVLLLCFDELGFLWFGRLESHASFFFSLEFYDFLFILFKREIPPPSREIYDFWKTVILYQNYIYIYIFSAGVYLIPHISYFAVCTQYLNCFQWFAGLSLKSQELTAIFLAVRLYCSFVMEYDIHTLLDLATFLTTLWVIYMIRFNLKSSYMEDKDNFAIYYVVSFW